MAVLVAALCTSACSAEKAKDEATGLGLAFGLVAASPLLVVSVPYATVESVVDSHNRKAMAERLDPVYREFTRSIRGRDAAADADAVFRESGASFLVALHPEHPNGMRRIPVPGVRNPDSFVCGRIAPYGDSTTLATSLRNLLSNDPITKDSGAWLDATSLASWKDYEDYRTYYAASFNRRMVEIAAPAGVVARPDGNERWIPCSTLCNLETGVSVEWGGPSTAASRTACTDLPESQPAR